jgi:hypothetical protein
MEDVPFVDVAEIGETGGDRGKPESQPEEEDRGPEEETDPSGDRHGVEGYGADGG